MENNSNLTFNAEDFESFKDWLKLDINGITWQGKNKASFQEFWSHFFCEGLSLIQVIQRFEFLQKKINVGPISSWFLWLRDRFICYAFIHKDLSLKELSREIEMKVGHVALILRSYLVDSYPHLEIYFSEKFQVAHEIEEKSNLKFTDLKKEAFADPIRDNLSEDGVMSQMEITLYDEWLSLIDIMKRDLSSKSLEAKRNPLTHSLLSQLSKLRDVVAIVVICLLVAWVFKYFNMWYGQKIINQISVYEPKFEWLDKSLIFKSQDTTPNLQVDFKDIEDVPDVVPFNSEFKEEERFEVESEVEITSWDQLPKDIEVADSEISEYEEYKNTGSGYRDFRYGSTTVYRVMMKSANTTMSREKLKKLMDAYNVTQVDNVKPGLDVPGGIYFNIFVPREFIKEFLSQVMEVDKAILYESKTRTTRNPPGKNKVFIWVKSI